MRPTSDYLKLFLAFRSLPQTSRERTFMEVSGNPHYENVSSNILAFYFNPAAEHKLGDLLLSAFFDMAGVRAKPSTGNVVVRRELSTDELKRIDLIVENEEFTVAIENKIYHWLANDLEEYARTIDRTARNKTLLIKAVLGLRLRPTEDSLKGGFSNYSYAQLWRHVRARLGDYISKANPKWVTYLLDFMETTTNLAGQNMELQKTDQFFIDHNDVIQELVDQRNEFLGRLAQKLVALNGMISELPEAKALAQPPRVWGNCCVVLNFQFADTYMVSFDCYLWPTGWELQLFSRNTKSNGYFHTLLNQPVLQERVRNAPLRDTRLAVQTWPVGADLGDIRDAVQSWMQTVIRAAAATAV